MTINDYVTINLDYDLIGNTVMDGFLGEESERVLFNPSFAGIPQVQKMQAWIEGFKFENYWDNTTSCLDLISNATWVQADYMSHAMDMGSS